MTAPFADDLHSVSKALLAAQLMAEGYGKPKTAGAMANASEALSRIAERPHTAALRRLASTETFTTALDLNHPNRVETQAVIDELQARMRFASEALA